ncbi:hypothetical protein ASPCAL14895 [Aspergillus calidoustus]|uniref:Uncharacterized protein n=1 Tax=Aspergillus calidoustus TaxID=454130 RepID=A0A0U5GK45_ASPCI|nr:hypothetical protein ASPCAL14895 [Aspergillus calidoustus]
MDLFLYNPTYQVWICTATSCQYAVTTSTLLTHLRTHHHSHPTAATLPLREAALEAMLQRAWADPAQEPGRQPTTGDPPVPGLPVYQGYGCPHCPYIAWTLESTNGHRRAQHKEQDGTWGPGRLSAARARARQQARLANRVVSCQRFYVTQAGSHFFEVTYTAALTAARGMKKKPALTPAELVRARVDQALREGEVAVERAAGQVLVLDPHLTEASPWLELTRWPEYLRGQDLTAVALLGGPPDPREEPLPAQLAASVQRLVSQAYDAIQGGQINEFN